MNLLHFSFADVSGGAAQATYQIHTALRNAGHASLLAVMRKDSEDGDVIRVGGRVPCRWDPGEWCERVSARLRRAHRVPAVARTFCRNVAPVLDLSPVSGRMPKPDVILLHWIAGMLTVVDIQRLHRRFQCPIVWIMLDMEPLSGGCHYPGDCTRYQDVCRCCPQLVRPSPRDLANRTWSAKHRYLVNLPLTFVTPSPWLHDRLVQSSLFSRCRSETILLPISPVMRPVQQEVARDLLGLPQTAKIILVGCQQLSDPRKGMHLLIDAARITVQPEVLSRAGTRIEDILFLVIGRGGGALCRDLPAASRYLGHLRSDIELALTYQASDFFACPSCEDAGPMMISQSMLCGRPVVAFDMGLAPELIISRENGYTAKLGDVGDFARGLEWMFGHCTVAGLRASQTAAAKHNPASITRAYEDLLGDLAEHGRERRLGHDGILETDPEIRS